MSPMLERWQQLRDELGEVRLIAVSKYAEDASVAELIAAGQVDFGEARPQQLRDRAHRWSDCRWHMIGPLQRNKAKYIGRHAAMWHSLEDLDTAREVARHVIGRRLPVLIQVNIGHRPQQHGVEPGDVGALLDELRQIPELEVVGLMCMVPEDGRAPVQFAAMRQLRDTLFPRGGELCMGMSGDYRLAIAAGATMVRLGSLIFEEPA